MKVAVYSGNIPSSTFIENLIRAIASDEVQVLLFGKIGREGIRYENPNIRIHSSPENGWQVIPFVIARATMLLFGHPERFRLLSNHINSQEHTFKNKWVLWAEYLPVVLNLPGIFHLQWVNGCKEWLFLKQLFGVKYVVSLRGSQINHGPVINDKMASVFRTTFPHVDRFHAVSVSTAASGQIYGAGPDRTEVIYTGLDLALIAKYKRKARYERGETLQFISVGRMVWSKGYQLAFDALSVLLREGYKIHYTIIGGAPDEELLFQMSELNLMEHITIAGNLSQDQVFHMMRSADLLLHPSYSEGVSNAVLEAMAIGQPVVCSDCGGMAEVIDNRKTGWLFENRNVVSLLAVIREVLSLSDEMIAEVTANASEKISREHSLEKLSVSMISLYRGV